MSYMFNKANKGKTYHSSPSSRLGELDVLRGLAALSIVVFHYTSAYPQLYNPYEPVLFNFYSGKYGVDLFFIISGFVIFMTLEKASSPLDFIVSRFSRLFPCYWAAVILTFLVVEKYSLYNSSLMQVSFKRCFLINLSMLQGWFNVRHIDQVYWTLEVELLFYAVMFLVFTAKAMKNIEALGLSWLFIWS